MPKDELYNLPPREDKYLTEQEVRAIVSSSQENFTASATVRTGHWKSNNFVSGSTGWKIKGNGDCEFNSGTFRGKLIAGSIHIPDEITANSFHTETDGDSYWGCNVADWASDNDNAKAFILKTGNAKFQDITLEGLVILKDLQDGSVIEGEYINALAVGKLASGTILSKQISLGITGGSGDAYISGGAGLDYANWTADKGFILGLDDSDNDLAKFFIGDHANNKYFSFDGTNTDATGFRYIEIFEAGEDISVGDIVCLKPLYTDYFPIDDAYVDQANPATNYGSNIELKTGDDSSGNTKDSYLKWDMSYICQTEYILKAELIIYANWINGTPPTQQIYRVSGADWTEETINWNNKPAYTNDISTVYGTRSSFTVPNIGYYTIELTQFIRHLKAGNIPNYGIVLHGSSSSDEGVNYTSKEGATTDKPVLRIYKTASSNQKIYKASCDDYMLCRSVIGIALENISSGNSGKVQIQGVSSGSFGVATGGKIYLGDTAGSTTPSTNNLSRVISLGKSVATNKAIIEIQNNDIFIEKLYTDNILSATLASRRFYAPSEARYAKIIVLTGTSPNTYDVLTIERGDSDYNSVYFSTSRNGNLWNISWGTNFIDILPNNSGQIRNVYFYT